MAERKLKTTAPPSARRAIPPLVTTDWLDRHRDDGLVIVDIRAVDEYKKGHIPSAVNVPFTLWAITRGELLIELPAVGDLFSLIGGAGIKDDSRVVLVNKTDDPHDQANTTRVACTLFYAGIRDVAILDGGYNKWLKEKKTVTKANAEPPPTEYEGKLKPGLFVSKEYVESKLGESAIIDARDPSDFYGATQEPYTTRPGHIPTAVCLPTPWVWTEEGTFKSLDELREMARGAVGEDTSQEIIVYCGVGGYASTWCFVLRELLGYSDVKIYDGAAQEWTRDPQAPVVKYRW